MFGTVKKEETNFLTSAANTKLNQPKRFSRALFKHQKKEKKGWG